MRPRHRATKWTYDVVVPVRNNGLDTSVLVDQLWRLSMGDHGAYLENYVDKDGEREIKNSADWGQFYR